MKSIIEIDDISFSYGRSLIIRDLSLNVPRGEMLGILGPNGAGKSTLINIIGGVLKKDSGSINIDGTDTEILSQKDIAKKIALVPQMQSTPFALTSFEIVLMGRTPYISSFGFESKEDVEIAIDAMKRTDCYEFASRSIDELSGGERQRVLLARALAQKTEILILDEPTTFLDIKHIASLKRMLHKLNSDNGLTIICALHDINIASSLCKKIIFLKQGRIEASGTPQEIIEQKTIERVFDTQVQIENDARTGQPYFLI